jgi:subtilase family serine protease
MKYLYILLLLICSTGLLRAQDPAYPPTAATALQVTAAEYFVDTDPGAGNGTSIPLTPGVTISNLGTSINISGLSNGLHQLYIRTRNAEGRWSITSVRDFLYDADVVYHSAPPAAQNIIAAEYFIDTDPGNGNGSAISITPGVDMANVPVSVNTGSLTTGVHRLYIRVKNAEGGWSLTSVKDFVVDFDFNYPTPLPAAQNLTSAEYFIDTDPGFGNATQISLTPGIEIANQTTAINTASLSIGTHRLYIRFRNNEGRWSLVSVKEFLVDNEVAYPVPPAAAQNVVAVEYFIDTDPGTGNGNSIAITPAINLNNINTAVNTSGLAIGTHRLYVRTRSNEGHWSITNVRDFIVDSEIGYPAAPPAVQNVIMAEYFIDTDPGHGSGTPVTLNAGVDLQNIPVAVNTAGLTNGTHHLFIRTRNQEGRWSITQQASFVTSLITLSEDTILFGNTPVNIANAKQLVIKNESSSAQTITGINIAAPFTTDFAGTVSIAAGGADTINVIFTPTAAQSYEETMTVQTSAGNFDVFLSGTGISQALSWSIDPATGHNYGAVATGTPAVFNFTIRNTGNVPVILSSVTSSDAAFVPTFTPGTSIASNASITLPVTFTPVAIASYTAQLKINSSTTGLDSVTATLSGTGYTPGTPPVLNFPAASPYQSVRGVNAEAGQTGLYTYKIVYRSANNRVPGAGFPKVGIDRNGDGDFDDLDEGLFQMTKEGTGVDYVAGVTYTYTISHPQYSSTLGYRFFASDDLGNTATTVDVAYKTGPVITYQLLDLKIFANDISFSATNPLPGDVFTLSANVTNSSAYTATNVPVKFYKDTILFASAVIPVIGPFSTATITKAMSFPTDGFYPIKVWIDSARTLNESNVLNNYAIRPIVVGTVTLPGGITVTPNPATIQKCPLGVVFSGSAVYYGTINPTAVAGAEVTINTGSQIYKTTTNADGSFSYLLNNPPCGGSLSYQVTVTDFTFTSLPKAGSVAVACPGANDCSPVIQPGINVTSLFSSQPCAQTVGSTGGLNVVVTYRPRNLANFWCNWDQILKDTVKIYHNGLLIATYGSADGTTSPGAVKTFPVNITLNASGPNVIEARQTYIYNEFYEIPSVFYKGLMIPMTGYGTNTLMAEPKLPDLTIQDFHQTNFRTFVYRDANIACEDAGQHTVRVYDSIPGSGTWVLLKEDVVASLAALDSRSFSFNGSTLAFGEHFIKIITDEETAIAEKSESNNQFVTSIFIPRPDLTVGVITPDITNASIGSQVKFTANIKNSGTQAGTFRVIFMVNGTPIGNKVVVPGVDERDFIPVRSDAYTVTTSDKDCPMVIDVMADVDGQIVESNESNNASSLQFGSDIVPLMLPGEAGSASNPIIVRVSSPQTFYPLIRNLGTRDLNGVNLKFVYNGTTIGQDSVGPLKAGQMFYVSASFTRSFTAPGNYVVQVIADTLNAACEINESNNEGTYHIKVVDSNPDLEVLSQYISPSSLNPQPGQSVTLVGTVRNAGLKPTPGSVLRFMVDEIQLGEDVAVDALLPGQDTTVAATATYSSPIPGVKVMKIIVDPAQTVTEEREDNNEATRTLIVGDAPDLAKRPLNALRFESGFRAGDSVLVHYAIKNNGSLEGKAWVRFMVLDQLNGVIGIDSVQFSLGVNRDTVISKMMQVNVNKGSIIAQIANCEPVEYDLTNNTDTLAFSNVVMLTRSLTVNGDLDMKKGITEELPEWIGGKLILGDFDLEVNGVVLNFDSTHFVITDGQGRLRLANNNTTNVFPVGPSEYSSNFAKLTNSGTADHFSMRVVPGVLSNGTAGDSVKTGNVNRTWLIDERVAGGSNVTLELFWYQPDEQPGFAPLTSRLGHYVSGAWDLGIMDSPVQDSAGRFSRFHNGYNGFSPFIVTSGTGVALPVELLAFDAVLQGDKTLLKWKTSDEVNSSHFQIQHSLNGRQFNDVGRISTNNTVGIFNYQFIHNEPKIGTNYYRLKMVDIDGSFTYSAVREVVMNGLIALQVYPSPAKQMITVRGLQANGTVQLISLDGKVLRQLNTTDSMMIMNLDDLPSGVYVIIYRNNGLYQQVKFIRE